MGGGGERFEQLKASVFFFKEVI
eukprot:SAG11_NODE_20589_length_442_cov_0.897959_2_plen_22_part_01